MALVIAVAYFLILSIGVSFFLRKKVKSGSDFVTGGGQLAWPLVTAAFVLAPLGSGHTFSLWQSSADLGASVLWWGMISGGVFVPLFLLWFGPWFRRLDVKTFPEGMGKLFGEKIGWLISAVFPAQLIGICIAEVMATSAALFTLSGGENGRLDMVPDCLLLAVVLTILYIVAAGLMQVAWMNLFNAIMLVVGSFAAVFYTGHWLSTEHEGWQGIADFYTNAGEAWKLSIDHFSSGVVLGIIIPCLFVLVFMCSASQAQNQPMLLARSESDIRRGVFWASFVNSMVTYPWVVLALVGMTFPAILSLGGEAANASVPELALMALPSWMVGILMIALLAATLSTTSILILSSSHIIVHDIFRKVVNPGMTDKTFLIITRITILVCMGLVILPALRSPKILPLLMWIFSFAIPVFGVYLIGMMWKINKTAAWITIVAGYVADFLWTIVPPFGLPEDLYSNVYPTTVVTIVFGVVLNLILPGKPGYLRQLKAKEREAKAQA